MTVNFTLRAESGSLTWFWVLWVELPSDGLSLSAAPRSLSRGWLERRCGEENSVTLSVLPQIWTHELPPSFWRNQSEDRVTQAPQSPIVISLSSLPHPYLAALEPEPAIEMGGE